MLGQNIWAAWNAAAPDWELVPTTRADADLKDPSATQALIARIKPDVVLHAAAKVGGIAANVASPASFLMDNLLIDSSVIESARTLGVQKLLYLGSSCMYPKDYRQPLVEGDVLAAPPEPTNEGYALSKIVAAKYCQFASEQYGLDYKVILPSNLYGPGDHYSLKTGHLVAAAIAKAHAAKESRSEFIDVWGDGSARREFTYVGDLARWIVNAAPDLSVLPAFLNVGFGKDHSVLDYYRTAMKVVGYECELRTDPTKPSGMKQKLMDSSVARTLGWAPETSLDAGMAIAYSAFLDSLAGRAS